MARVRDRSASPNDWFLRTLVVIADDFSLACRRGRAVARRFRRVRCRGRTPRASLAEACVAPRASRDLGRVDRIQRLDLPTHAARERTARTRGTGRLFWRLRGTLCVACPLSGRPHKGNAVGSRGAGPDHQRTRVRITLDASETRPSMKTDFRAAYAPARPTRIDPVHALRSD